MPERLPQHRHCITCGKATSLKNQYCSDTCEQEHVSTIKKKRKQLLALYAISIIAVVVVFLISLVSR